MKEQDSLEDVGIDGRIIILKWFLNKWDGEWTELIWLRTDTDGGLL
jgi:hypothetical protein